MALVGILGYGAATGRLDRDKMEQYLATWRGEKLVPPPIEEIVEVEDESPQEASARILSDQIEREVLNREMQLYAQLLRDKEVSIAATQAKLEKDLKKLQAKNSEFNDRVIQHNKMAQEEGFQKALKSYSLMNPKLVKEDFMKMDDADVIRYLAEMKPDNATAILEKFKTPDEQIKRCRMMKLLELYGKIDPKKNNDSFSKK